MDIGNLRPQYKNIPKVSRTEAEKSAVKENNFLKSLPLNGLARIEAAITIEPESTFDDQCPEQTFDGTEDALNHDKPVDRSRQKSF